MSMAPREHHSSIQTQSSLLNRLKTGDDVESWQEFYRTYGKLVRDFAIQAGLTDTEADEVMQETAIGIARHLPEYRYDPKVCRFKTWLLNLTSWRIKDQFKKRKPGAACLAAGTFETPVSVCDDTTRTATIHRMADPNAVNLDELFEREWRRNRMATAMERIREKFSLKQYQIFDLLVIKEWPPADVARSLGVSLANVYVTKHRISAAVKKEIKRLEMQFEERSEHERNNQKLL
jgi:RNA polymerase sigma factor (sigma-70 family)